MLSEPRAGRLHRDDAGAGQLLVRLGSRQRLVRVGADRGEAGPAGGARSRRVAAGADGLRHLLRQPPADRLQRQRVAPGRPADRARCTAATTSTRDRPATTTARSTATPGSRCTSAWAATRCPATCGGGRGGPLPPQLCPTDPAPSATPGTGYWQTYTDPQSGKQFDGVGGPLHLPRHVAHVRPDVRRRHVRGADGEPGRARDDLGTPQLRPRRPALGAGPGEVRDAGARLSGVGDVAVEHGRRHRQLRRLRGRGPGVRQRFAAGVVHDLRHREHGQPARLGDRAAGAAAGGVRESGDAADALSRGSTPPTAGSTTRSTR